MAIIPITTDRNSDAETEVLWKQNIGLRLQLFTSNVNNSKNSEALTSNVINPPAIYGEQFLL
jgi:hypothetical protein